MKRTALLPLLLLAACSSSTEPQVAGPSVTAPPASGSVTWQDGTVLRGTVTVPAGSTVTLAPKAKVTAAEGSELVVEGRLLVPSGGAITGKSWGGLTVGSAGVVRATDLAMAGGTALVKGTLEATRLRFDQGSRSGMVINGTLRLTDSELLGDGSYSGDMLTTDDARELTVKGTEIHGVHCAFHLVGVDALELSDLDVHGNAYGFMAYGSSTSRVHHITDSDVYDNRDFGLYESPGTKQGRIVVDGGYWGDNGDQAIDTLSQTTGKIERVNPLAARRS